MFKCNLRSIKVKMILIFGALVLSICLGLSIMSQSIAGKALENTVDMILPQTAEQAALAIESEIQTNKKLLEQLARHSKVTNKNIIIPQKMTLLKGEAEESGALFLGIADLKGNLYLCDTSMYNISDRTYFKEALEGKTYISEPFVSDNINKRIIAYATPIRDFKNEIFGILVSLRDYNEISGYSDKIEIGESGYAFVLDSNGITIAHPDIEKVENEVSVIEQAESNKSYKELADIHSKMISGKKDIGEYNLNREKKYIAYAPILSTGWSVGIVINKDEVLKEVSIMRNTSQVATIIFLVISIVIVLFFTNLLMKHFSTIIQYLNEISSGNLKVSIKNQYLGKSDEFGMIAQAVNRMQYSIKEMMLKIKNIVEEVEGQSENLSQTSDEMSMASNNVAELTHQAAVSTEEQATKLINITTILDEFNKEMQKLIEVIDTIHDSNKEIENMANISNKDMKNVVKSVEEMNEIFAARVNQIRDVGINIRKINDITSLINDIAEQTNLLALNAAIEAARAGESGRGFAVVADEIRKLAEESRTSAENIANIIKNVSNETNKIITDTENVKDQLMSQHNNIDTAVGSFKKIIEAVQEINPLVKQANDTVKYISESKDTIVYEIENASAIAEEISASSEEMAASSEQMNSSIEEIASSVHNLNGVTKSMTEEVNKFKL